MYVLYKRIVPDKIINEIPKIDKVSRLSEKKILPNKLAHKIWVNKKGLIILLYLPAIWNATVQNKIAKNINKPAEKIKINSLREGIIGSTIKKKAEKIVNGKIL